MWRPEAADLVLRAASCCSALGVQRSSEGGWQLCSGTPAAGCAAGAGGAGGQQAAAGRHAGRGRADRSTGGWLQRSVQCKNAQHPVQLEGRHAEPALVQSWSALTAQSTSLCLIPSVNPNPIQLMTAEGPELMRACMPLPPVPCTTHTQIIIGDEILSAKVEEVNTRFLCAELRAIGWQVCKASAGGGGGAVRCGGHMGGGGVAGSVGCKAEAARGDCAGRAPVAAEPLGTRLPWHVIKPSALFSPEGYPLHSAAPHVLLRLLPPLSIPLHRRWY